MLKGLRGRGPDSTGPRAVRAGRRRHARGARLVQRVGGGRRRRAGCGPSRPGASRRPTTSGASCASGCPTDVPVETVCTVIEGGDADVEVFSVGAPLQIYKHLTDGEAAGASTTACTARPAATAWGTPGWPRSRASTCSTPTPSGPGRTPTSASSTTATSRTTTSSSKRYELRGHRFFTGNDSELLALYLAERLHAGRVHRARPWRTRSATSTARSPTCAPRARGSAWRATASAPCRA